MQQFMWLSVQPHHLLGYIRYLTLNILIYYYYCINVKIARSNFTSTLLLYYNLAIYKNLDTSKIEL